VTIFKSCLGGNSFFFVGSLIILSSLRGTSTTNFLSLPLHALFSFSIYIVSLFLFAFFSVTVTSCDPLDSVLLPFGYR
jgi:hypothetical protein